MGLKLANMKNSFIYNLTSDSDYDLIIEPGPHHYEFKSQELINVEFIETNNEKKLCQEDVFISFENGTITLILNSIGVSCKFVIKKNEKILDEFVFF